MELDFEENFVNKFINTAYRDRLLYELRSSKKRINALMRFSHNIEGLLKEEKIYSRLKQFNEGEIKSFLKEKNYYILSFKYLEGHIMDINEMFNYIYDEYSPVVVCGTDVAVVKKEFEKGEYNYYLLKY